MTELNTTTEILTVAEARRRLPEVRPLVGRMMGITAEADTLRLRPRRRAGSPDESPDSVDRRLGELRGELEETIREINLLGAMVKDPARGLIDFFAWRGDEMVHLCWLHGEGTVGYWHGIKDGFAGRRSIDGDEVF